MRLFISILFIFIFFSDTYSQEVIDVIYLKNETIIKGEIIGRVKNESVTIKTLEGNTYLVDVIAIKKIRREVLEIPFDKRSRLLFFMSLGFSVPVADSEFRKSNLTGFNINFDGAYELNRDLAIRVDFQYNNLPPETGGSSFSMLVLKSDLLIYSLKELAINPYAFIGGGVYALNVTREFRPRLGAGFGVGLNFRFSKNKLYFFGEAQFNYLFHGGKEKMYLPGRIGIMFTNKLFTGED
ncbi:hypothetical protein ACFLSV_00580 [Bacteroidota bacterium]